MREQVSESLLREIRRASAVRQQRQTALREATAQVEALVLRGRAAGMSERDLATEAGVARETIRKWIGKPWRRKPADL